MTGFSYRLALALLRARENMVLRRAAALANAVGATRLAQGGAKILITLGRDQLWLSRAEYLLIGFHLL